jgi:hypothetical protein
MAAAAALFPPRSFINSLFQYIQNQSIKYADMPRGIAFALIRTELSHLINSWFIPGISSYIDPSRPYQHFQQLLSLTATGSGAAGVKKFTFKDIVYRLIMLIDQGSSLFSPITESRKDLKLVDGGALEKTLTAFLGELRPAPLHFSYDSKELESIFGNTYSDPRLEDAAMRMVGSLFYPEHSPAQRVVLTLGEGASTQHAEKIALTLHHILFKDSSTQQWDKTTLMVYAFYDAESAYRSITFSVGNHTYAQDLYRMMLAKSYALTEIFKVTTPSRSAKPESSTYQFSLPATATTYALALKDFFALLPLHLHRGAGAWRLDPIITTPFVQEFLIAAHVEAPLAIAATTAAGGAGAGAGAGVATGTDHDKTAARTTAEPSSAYSFCASVISSLMTRVGPSEKASAGGDETGIELHPIPRTSEGSR